MSALNEVLNALSGTPGFRPISADVFPDWSIEAGDIVSIDTGSGNDGGMTFPVFSADMDWNGAAKGTLSCSGNKERTTLRKQERETYSAAGGAVRAANKHTDDKILEDYNQLIAALNGADGVPEDLAAGLQNYVRYDLKNGDMLSSSQLFAEIGNKARAEIGVYAVSSGGTTKTFAQILADVIKLQGDVEIVGNLSIEGGFLKVAKGIRTNEDVYAHAFHSSSVSMFFGTNNSLTVNTKVQINPSNIIFGGVTYVPKQITYVTKTGYASSKLLTLDKDRYEENFDPQGADQVIRRLKTMSNPVRKPKNPTAVLSVRYTAPENIPAGTTISVPAPANLYDCTTWENYYEKPEYDYVGYYKSTSNPETATDTVLAQSGSAESQAAEAKTEVIL